MAFARWVFLIAGVYGVLIILPMYFLEPLMFQDDPRGPLVHPEFYYGFVGVALAWQVAFLIIARDPVRFRPLMVACVLEKVTFGVAAIVLFAQQRIPAMMLAGGGVDLLLAVLFLIAWLRCAPDTKAGG